MGRRPFRRFRYQRRPPWERPWKPRGPLLPGRMLNPRLQKEIRRANHLLATGDHGNAGRIFENLAVKALDLNFPYPAPLLFMQAAHAFALGGDIERAENPGRRGLEMLASQERWPLLTFEFKRYVDTLQSMGESGEINSIQNLLEKYRKQQEGEQAKPIDSTIRLPEKCPYCGGTMDLDILKGAHQAAACQYCGSVVLARPEE